MTVYLPHDLDEALDLRARCPEATPIAGGTDLIVQMKTGRRTQPNCSACGNWSGWPWRKARSA